MNWRAAIHYLLAVVILSIYGVQVCPFLESLSTIQLTLPIISSVAILFVLSWLMSRRIHGCIGPMYQPARIFRLQLILFIAAGMGMAIFNTLVYDFPLESGLKLVLGVGLLGFFVAIDLALQREWEIAHALRHSGEELVPDRNFMPLTRKAATFATVAVAAIIAVMFLVINKDLDWLIGLQGELSLKDARLSILAEMAFVMGVVLLYVFNTIHGFTRNMRLFLDAENHVLGEAATGHLDERVVVSRNDEFGLMAHRTNRMVEGLRSLTVRLRKTRDVTLHSLAILAETRDNETGAHILRTQHYVRALADYLRQQPSHAALLDDERVELLYKSAPLHDIGKVGIPDAILLKPGKHTPEEFAIMKTHAMIGGEAIRRAEAELGEDSFLQLAREIADGHHEKWDGSGYPRGLSGEAIPLSARLMAVADVYDALISRRVYKPAFPHSKAREIILEGRGQHFDPAVVDAFIAIEDEFVTIASRYADEYTHSPDCRD